MLERHIHGLSVVDAGREEPAATRERLREAFPRNATRRMTQLGLLLGAAMNELGPRADDAIVYASRYAESRALEAYLESFPTASPTMFQTSIHPSAVQQTMIARQHPVREFFPMTGRSHLVAQAIQAAMLTQAPRAVLCGGEERGTWLLEQGFASARTFAFALALGGRQEGSIGMVTLERTQEPAAELPLERFFEALAARETVDLVAAPGARLRIMWRP